MTNKANDEDGDDDEEEKKKFTLSAAREFGCGAFFAACFLILFAVFILNYKKPLPTHTHCCLYSFSLSLSLTDASSIYSDTYTQAVSRVYTNIDSDVTLTLSLSLIKYILDTRIVTRSILLRSNELHLRGAATTI